MRIYGWNTETGMMIVDDKIRVLAMDIMNSTKLLPTISSNDPSEITLTFGDYNSDKAIDIEISDDGRITYNMYLSGYVSSDEKVTDDGDLIELTEEEETTERQLCLERINELINFKYLL